MGRPERRLYRMFHSTVLPTILRNFDRLSMAHGVEVRMPFMDWRLVTYTMALPESSKSADGYTKAVARRAMANADAGVDPHGAPQGRLQFADAGMAERTPGRLVRPTCSTGMCRRLPNWWMKRLCARRSAA